MTAGPDEQTGDKPMPLSGVRVLEFGQAVSSPLCTMLLGDLGADVVKIEPPHGDAARGYGPPFVSGESPYYLSCNRNKRSTALNIKHEQGAAIVRRMCEEADIIVTNFRPGVMDRLGIGYESLKQVNPSLIFCQVTGYGPDGPFAGQPAYDQVAQGMSGLMSVTGTVESGPIRVGVAIGDVLAALHATVGVLGAWAHRQNTGEGQRVDTSLLGAILGILTYQTGRYLADGSEPQREGNDHPVAAPYGAFSTQDGQINIAIANENMWRRLAEVLGHPEWVDDPRFASNADRVNNRPAINELVTEALSTDTVNSWVTRLNEAGVACGPIWTVGESLESEQVANMGMVQQVEHDLAGQINLIGPAISMTATPQVIHRSPPLLAQHTAEVLEELGFSGEEIGKLAADDAVVLGPVTRAAQS
ncbi:MAG: CoA transferase [Sphaerobacteraceae bacterium]|nr:MAG: CoA transferase [Sphaerobacteraceae bacterium]